MLCYLSPPNAQPVHLLRVQILQSCRSPAICPQKEPESDKRSLWNFSLSGEAAPWLFHVAAYVLRSPAKYSAVPP